MDVQEFSFIDVTPKIVAREGIGDFSIKNANIESDCCCLPQCMCSICCFVRVLLQGNLAVGICI